MVTLYTTPSCVYCINLKEFLRQHNIAFQERDVSQDQKALQEMRDKSGQMGVPVTDIDSTIVVGFDREKITQLLSIQE